MRAEYLGSDQPNFTLNFSKSASMIIGQYYQFVRLGFDGYKKIMASLLNVAQRLQEGVQKLGPPAPPFPLSPFPWAPPSHSANQCCPV